MALAEEVQALSSINIDLEKERTKPRLVAFLFCDFINVTSERKHNLLGVFDRVTLTENTRPLSLGFYLRAANAVEGSLEVLMYGPDNVLASGFTMTPDVEAAKEGGHTHLQAFGQLSIEFKMEGTFWFGVTYQGELIGGSRLEVKFQPEEKKDEHGSAEAKQSAKDDTK